MGWLPVIGLALAAFAVAAFVAKLPRPGWMMFGACLLFGLAGYAMQANPQLAGAPKDPVATRDSNVGPAMIEARRLLFDPSQPPSAFVTMADGYTRQGRFDDAASILGGALRENPRDTEAWIALGNTLVEHAEGVPTAAALYAYAQAELIDPAHPAPPYFLGVALLRTERFADARTVWAQMIERAPEGAEWLPAMQERLAQLDAMLAQGMPQAPERAPAQPPAEVAPGL